jgi:hypothetical protein
VAVRDIADDISRVRLTSLIDQLDNMELQVGQHCWSEKPQAVSLHLEASHGSCQPQGQAHTRPCNNGAQSWAINAAPSTCLMQ